MVMEGEAMGNVVAMFSGRKGAHLMRRCAPDEDGRGDRKVEGASGLHEKQLKRAAAARNTPCRRAQSAHRSTAANNF